MEDDSVSERADQQNRTRTAAAPSQMPLAARQQAIFTPNAAKSAGNAQLFATNYIAKE
jgi:hypothetical protein